MTIRHHPTDETLAAFAGATLDEGNSLVVATHLATCESCRALARRFEGAVGAMIEDGVGAGAAVDPLSRAMVLDRISDVSQLARPVRSGPSGPQDHGRMPISIYKDEQWRWIGMGVQWKPVAVDPSAGTRVFMLKAAPGTRLPDHRHRGTEWTCVLAGAFSHELGRFGPGDFDEADDSVDHSPYVEREGACICLVALNGRIELKSWIGRVLQPLVRF